MFLTLTCSRRADDYNQITIAEKHIRPDSGSNKTDWEKLLREVRTLRRRQNHPHIINLLAAYQQEIDESGLPVKTLHLLFPWAEQDLKEWMNERSTPSNVRSLSRKERQDFLYRCIYSLVSGLCYLHSEIEGTIATHHDLKPGNVLWVDGELKIADFGHSHLRSVIEGSRTEGKSEVGTYEYQPPEYWNDDGSRSETKPGRDLDIWAMSCIILELLVLVIYDWQSGELARFARERHDDQNPNRKRTERYLANDDYSFHNSLEVVRAWFTALYESRSSDHPQPPKRLVSVLTVVFDMQVLRPCDRKSMWESQMDLHKILKRYDNRIPFLEEDLCVPPQAPRTARPTISNRTDLVDTPLHRAVRDNNWSRTIRLWELGWSRSSANDNLETPLMMMKASKDSRFRSLPNDVSQMLKAARDGRINELKQLFGKGLTPLMTGEDGQSALCQAISGFQSLGSKHDHLKNESCRKNNAQIMLTIDFLLKSKAKDQLMLASGSAKNLPLQEAASRGFVEAMRRILREGVNINGCGEMEHITPLYLAAKGCHLEAVKLLLEHKAKVCPYPGPSVQETPFHAVLLSSEDDHPKYEILESLLKAHDGQDCIDSEITFDGTPLMVAARRGDLRCCELLVRYGASIHATVLDGYGLLHEIARRGWSDFLRQILDQFSLEELEARSRPEYMHSVYVTPRELAKTNKHKSIVHLLDDRLRELKGQESDLNGFLGLSFRLPGTKRKE